MACIHYLRIAKLDIQSRGQCGIKVTHWHLGCTIIALVVCAMAMHQDDVPGASLDGRNPERLKILELKHWLLCRGASTKGKKADLVARYY